MKRFLIAFFVVLVVNGAYAENYVIFKSDVVEKAINQLVASENRQSAADEYQKNMDQTNGKISVTGLYKVCIAAGFNIQTTDGYNLCRNFLNFMISESDFGTGSVTQQSCINTLNGVWTLSSDGKKYQCVGRDGNLLNYRKSCRDGGGTCIKQFDNLKTQGAKGREFINAYGTLKGLNFTCHANADISKLGQDYIMCSAGGNAYEFEFDSLNQSPNSTSSNSENKAICELYGGKIVNTGDKYTEDTWQSCDISSELCKGAVSSLAQRTGHSVQYQGYCRLSRGIKEVSTIFLNQIDGIDSRIFYNAGLQMRMDTAKPMVEEYLRTKFPNESYIVCGATPKILNEGLGIDKDYVISCTVGSQQVDFIFDDLSETFDNDAATGKEAMQCIINGGTFKGETCRGPTKEECEKLDAVLRSKGSDKGARYDDDARACILGNAESTYKRDVAIGYIIGAVVIVGGALVTIGTGGAAGPVVVNGVAMLAGDIAINYAMDANHQRLTNKAAKKFVDFVTDADACTTEQCALDVLEKHYATLSGVMIDLNTDDQAVVDATIDRLIGLIQTEFVACGENAAGQTVYASPADCAMQSSRLTLLDRIDPYSEAGLAIGSVIFDPGYVVTRFMRLKKVTKVASVATDAARATNKLDDAGKVVNIPEYKEVINPDIILDPAVKSIYLRAYSEEPKITNDLVEATKKLKGDLHGLEYRMKTPKSFLGKIERDRSEISVLDGTILSDADIAGNFKDIVRYTYATTPENLVSDTRALLQNLEEMGYKQIGPLKNTFLDSSNPVDMINIRMESPNGQVFELQANTPHNLYIKDNVMHSDYEKWRVLPDKNSTEAVEIMNRMLDLGKQYEVPKGIENLK